MVQLLVRLASSLGALITAGGVLSTAKDISPLVIILLWFVVAIAIVAAVADVVAHFQEADKKYDPNSKAIVKYMVRWLGSGGRAAVFSRDLSWAAEQSDAAGILEKKAKAGELVVFVGRQTPFIKKLVGFGATVHDYSTIGFEPQSRFTVIDYGKAGARVAIGLVENGKHLIREFGNDNHAVLAIASDLVTIASRVAKKVS